MSGNRKKILAISGSTRKNSTNEKILRLIASKYPDAIALEIFDGIDKLPHFNPDLDSEEFVPDSVKMFRHTLHEADAVIFCTPEYVFSLPGALKNAIEWTVSTTLFSHKPVAMIVASGVGEKAFESLQLILTTLETSLADGCSLLIKGARGKINVQGTFEDSGIMEELELLVDSLLGNIAGTK